MNKTETKTACKTLILDALGRIDSAVESIGAETNRFLRVVGVFEVQAGLGLDEIRSALATAKVAKVSLAKTPGIKTDDWRVLARERVPGKDVKTLYRWQNAGAVARVLGDDVGSALVGSLVPLYRILTAADRKGATAEDRSAAEDLVRSAWAEAVKDAGSDEDGTPVPPTESAVKEIAERLAPTTRSGGSETTVSEETAEDEDDDEDDEDDDETESRRESSESLVVVETAAVEAAAGPTDAILRGIGRDLVGKTLSDEGVKSIMLATLRLAGEHGVGTIVAVLAGKGAAPESAPETAPAETEKSA